MKNHCPLRYLLLILGLLAVTKANAQTVISSVPFTISASGKYVLGGNLSTGSAVAAITVNASNVILDLNGFYVSGPGNTPASTNAVIQVNDVSNVTIRNGTVANGAYGIRFSGNANSLNYLIESVNLTRCYIYGVQFVNPAPGSLVLGNSFSQIGGSTTAANVTVAAIRTKGGGIRIENNTISSVTPTGTADGYGIECLSADFTIGNSISNATYAIYMYTGGKNLNNLTSNCSSTPFLGGGTNATGNN